MEDNNSQPDASGFQPDSPTTALEWLDLGSRAYAASLPEDDSARQSFFTQSPFAAILSCSDARLPVGQVFNQDANRLFVVRLAGNVLSAEAMGSLRFAIEYLDSVQLAAVVGHTGCGAVTAAVSAYVSPETTLHPTGDSTLGGIVGYIWVSVHLAAQAMEQVYSLARKDLGRFAPALVDLAAVSHAALTAADLQGKLRRFKPGFQVFYGVYDLQTHQVGQPAPPDSESAWQLGLRPPPDEQAQMEPQIYQWARSAYIRKMLESIGL